MKTQSKSKEDYLKYIFLLQSEDKKVTTSALAGKLNISPASVSEMVAKLSKEGLIKNTPYHGFQLTKQGEKIAVNLVRKHRLIEVFLQEHLKYRWEEVHNEAEKLEHVCSDVFIDKLEEYLNFPKFDPHGDPIPDKHGKLENPDNMILSKSKEGKYYIVAKVKDSFDEILKYMSRIGIRLNSKIHLTEKISFDESVLISVNNKKHLLSKKMADNIYVVNTNE
ncbi:MAG: metal-dependent transcriptional regulator [Ignavibacteriae bacterium]|nr:MAG: metal-dependent transcriptional regulator [Ignavibacteriota bacterium]